MPQYRADKRTAVFGVFPTRASAEEGLDSLRLSGFGNSDVSAVLPNGESISGVVAWLTGVAQVTIPRAGLLLAAGPIVASLKRYGVSGALSGMANADYYEFRVRQGAVLVGVHCSNCDRITLASDVLRRSLAEDVAVPAMRQATASA